MSTEPILIEKHNCVLVITINRPEAKNALSLSMYQSLTEALKTLDKDEQLHVGVIRGSVDCFTAGNDLNDFLTGGELSEQHPTVEFLYQLANCQKPLVAAVSGVAIGVGTTMLLHCDLVYATDSAQFQLPFARLGLCPEAASSLMLPKLAGHQKAFQYLVLGETFNSDQAMELGLVNDKLAEKNIFEQVLTKANKLASLPQQAVTTSKCLLKRSQQQEINDCIKTEIKYFTKLLASDTAQAMINGFFTDK